MKRVVLPPDEPVSPDGVKAGGWWHAADDGRLVCDLCPRACHLGEGDRGFCFVRQNRGERMVSTTYGRSTGFCIDPVEKKPLNQFYPGTSILSFGTAGCNLGCKFCQNWSISKSRQVDDLAEAALPEDIAYTAQRRGCTSVAFTYNDPVIWAEYAIDTARACRRLGIKTVAVTAGYITPAARETFYREMDAANVDLKAFTEDFYRKLGSGHLEPVLDTLRWIVRESDTWLEITNLVIPGANDSPDELRRLCDWVVAELGPDVPLHFTAFHPDFRLRDRGPTPPETLAAAHDIARRAGVRYVYTGNISDRKHQSTYCPHCGRTVIERAGYELGLYALDGDRCRHCGNKIAGRFDRGPGDWGSRREPIRIAKAPPAAPQPSKGISTMETNANTPSRPTLTAEQESAVFAAAGRRVAAAVRAEAPDRMGEILGPIGQTPVFGSFVSLKRAGQLRSCCGSLGNSLPLAEALDHAAFRAATDDPRFPPISPSELEHLDMEVWLLWGCVPMNETGEDRVKAVEIGRHGLQIARGHNRGLLLPSVAVDHGLDALGFLRQVCLKAGLPVDAWKDDDATVMTFEGYAVRGKLATTIPARQEPALPPGGPSRAQVAALAGHCRTNLVNLLYGATPSYYMPGGFDGAVHGAVLSVHLPGVDAPIECSKFSMQGPIPLQATLFELCEAAARAVSGGRVDEAALGRASCGLSVFWDPAIQGSVAEHDLAGVSPASRAVMVLGASHWALAYDPKESPERLAAGAIERAKLREQPGQMFSLAVISTEAHLATGNVPRPQPGPAVRPPAVAGRFYPGTGGEVEKALDGMLPAELPTEPWAAAMVPHAGWTYSGKLAAATLARTCVPSQVIVLAPKHHPGGADWAIAPHRLWALPGRNLESDPDLAALLAERVSDLELDAEAHRAEHAIEVQLPILARLAPRSKAVGIVMHGGDLARLERFGNELAAALAEFRERPLLVVSSDMNHYADDARTREVDRLALDAIEALDPVRLFETVRGRKISMCGVLPMVAAMFALRRMGLLNHCEPVGYATSGDAGGGTDRVVGYAGLLLR